MKWNELSMADRARYIRLGVQNGVMDLNTIRDSYNSYRSGGLVNRYDSGSWLKDISNVKGKIVLKDKYGRRTLYNSAEEAMAAMGDGYSYKQIDPKFHYNGTGYVDSRSYLPEVEVVGHVPKSQLSKTLVNEQDLQSTLPSIEDIEARPEINDPVRNGIFEGRYNGHTFEATDANISRYLNIYEADKKVHEGYGWKQWGKIAEANIASAAAILGGAYALPAIGSAITSMGTAGTAANTLATELVGGALVTEGTNEAYKLITGRNQGYIGDAIDNIADLYEGSWLQKQMHDAGIFLPGDRGDYKLAGEFANPTWIYGKPLLTKGFNYAARGVNKALNSAIPRFKGYKRYYHGTDGEFYNPTNAYTGTVNDIGLHASEGPEIAKSMTGKNGNPHVLEFWAPKAKTTTIDTGRNDFGNQLTEARLRESYPNVPESEYQRIAELRQRQNELLNDFSADHSNEIAEINTEGSKILSDYGYDVVGYNNLNVNEGGGGASVFITNPSSIYKPRTFITPTDLSSSELYPFLSMRTPMGVKNPWGTGERYIREGYTPDPLYMQDGYGTNMLFNPYKEADPFKLSAREILTPSSFSTIRDKALSINKNFRGFKSYLPPPLRYKFDKSYRQRIDNLKNKAENPPDSPFFQREAMKLDEEIKDARHKFNEITASRPIDTSFEIFKQEGTPSRFEWNTNSIISDNEIYVDELGNSISLPMEKLANRKIIVNSNRYNNSISGLGVNNYSINTRQLEKAKSVIQKRNDRLREIVGDNGHIVGSSSLTESGHIAGIPGDDDIITTAARADNLIASLGGENIGELPGNTGFKIRSPHIRGGVGDIDVIQEVDGKATGKLAHEIFETLYPEQYRAIREAYAREASWRENITSPFSETGEFSYIPSIDEIPLPLSSEELFQALKNPDNVKMKGLSDVLFSHKSKHAFRAKTAISQPENAGMIKEILRRKSISLYGEDIALPKAMTFDNIEANKEVLKDLGLDTKLANNSEVMENICKYMYLSQGSSTRGIKVRDFLGFVDKTTLEDPDKFWELMQNSWSVNYSPSNSTLSGIGGNNTLGSRGGGNFGNALAINLAHLPDRIDNPKKLFDYIYGLERLTPEQRRALSKEFDINFTESNNLISVLENRGIPNTPEASKKIAEILDRDYLVGNPYGSEGKYIGRIDDPYMTGHTYSNRNGLNLEHGAFQPIPEEEYDMLKSTYLHEKDLEDLIPDSAEFEPLREYFRRKNKYKELEKEHYDLVNNVENSMVSLIGSRETLPYRFKKFQSSYKLNYSKFVRDLNRNIINPSYPSLIEDWIRGRFRKGKKFQTGGFKDFADSMGVGAVMPPPL